MDYFFEEQSRYDILFIGNVTCVIIITTGKRPELRHLVQLLAPISSRWDLLGGQLGVEGDFIEGLKNCEKALNTKLTEVLQKWIDTKPTPVTWEKVIEVVKGPVVQKVDVAVTIQEYLKHIRIEQRKVKRQSKPIPFDIYVY